MNTLSELERRRNLLAHRIAGAVAAGRTPAADIVTDYRLLTAEYDRALLALEEAEVAR